MENRKGIVEQLVKLNFYGILINFTFNKKLLKLNFYP